MGGLSGPRIVAKEGHRLTGQRPQHLGELITAVAVSPAEIDQLLHLRDDDTALRRPGDGDCTATADFQQSLVAKHPERAKDGVRMDPEDRGEILRLGNPLPGSCLAVRDRPSDLRGDLLVQIGLAGAIHGSESEFGVPVGG